MQKILFTLIIGFVLTSCLSSVSNKIVKENGIAEKDKALAILESAWKAHGFNEFIVHEVYEVTGVNHWKGIAGKFGKPWPKQKQELKFQYAVGTFDSRVTFLDGKKKGGQKGLQSWNYYEIPSGDSIVQFKKKSHQKTEFGLAAFQYFFELIDRLKKVELIAYGGEKEFNGKKYDLVFVTWHKLKTHKQNDQYMLWINKKTKMVDYCHFTVHGTAFPGRAVSGSIEYANFKNIDGVKIPFELILYTGLPKTNQSKYLHRLTVSDFKFDSFEKSELYPDKNIKSVGDSK